MILPWGKAAGLGEHGESLEEHIMCVVSEWDGSTARALRKALRMSQERFAEHLGVGVRTVRDWEAAGHKLTPVMAHQEALDTVLERSSADQRRRFEALCREEGMERAPGATWPQPDTPPADWLTGDLASGDSPQMAEHLGAAARIDADRVASVEDFTDSLASVNSSTRPDILIGPVVNHADLALGWLDRPMSEANRHRLDIATVETHTQAAMLAFLGGDRTTARRYFAVARTLADESGNPMLIAQTLAASSVLHSSIPQGGRGGNTRRAVTLLTLAADYAARSGDAPTRAWVHRWLAMELAAANDERGFRAHMEQAERLQPLPVLGRRGYFARAGGFEQVQEVDTAVNLGVGLVLLGHADEAIEALQSAQESACPRREVIVLADTAAARILQDEPEEAADTLLRARKLALKAGYLKGLERICGVRARAPRRHARLACMRSLDEQLRS